MPGAGVPRARAQSLGIRSGHAGTALPETADSACRSEIDASAREKGEQEEITEKSGGIRRLIHEQTVRRERLFFQAELTLNLPDAGQPKRVQGKDPAWSRR